MKKIKLSSMHRQEVFWGWILLLPSVLGLSIFYIYPFIENIYNSFAEISFIGDKTFVGLENYKVFFSDPRIIESFIYTLKYAFVTVPIVLVLSLIISASLNNKLKGSSFYRFVYYLPVIAMPVAIATVWKWMFNYDFGFFNYMLGIFNVDPVPWLRDNNTFFISLIFVSSWSRIGYNVLLLLAGLQNISESYYEASKLDGAGGIRQFFSITLPLLSPTIFFVIIINIISFLQVFDWIFTLTPLTSSVGEANTSVITLFYQYAFISNQKGVASALSVVFFFIILALTVSQFMLQKRWVHYEQ